MAEEQELTFDSLEELYTGIQNFKKDPLKTYTLVVGCPITTEAYIRLSSSDLGSVISQLTISFDAHEDDLLEDLEDSDEFEIDTSKGRFPLLRKLHFEWQPLQSIKFTKTRYPMLEELSVWHGRPNSIFLNLPKLKSLRLAYTYIGNGRGFGKSLSRCPMLTDYCSYKLLLCGGNGQQTIVAPNLQNFEIQRSEFLRGLTFWAPRIKTIKLRSCYALDEVNILDKIPEGNWGKDYQFTGQPSTYNVSTIVMLNLHELRGNLLTSNRFEKLREEYFNDFAIM